MELQELRSLCEQRLIDKNLTDEKYHQRLNTELEEIHNQAEVDYFPDLMQSGKKFAYNEHNLLVPFLLGLVDEFDIEQPAAYLQGEFPDIDMDYLPAVRDYLKNEWAIKQFGREYCSSISTYNSLGIKQALQDMAHVHDKLRSEVQAITRNMEDKDDDGKPMTWEKALELYPDFAAYCEQNKDVADAAKALKDRYKSHGVHAGGLIISSKPIANFVPLEVRSVNKDNPDGVIVAAWAEGQHVQELGPVGLIKFDLLVVDGLKQIAVACQLIQQRHNLPGICALPGKRNWTDTSYRNDPKAIAMANAADLKAIFQFDSDWIIKLIKQGGVNSFHDLPAYSSLNRPGPQQIEADRAYVRRKRGEEEYTIHPIMRSIVEKTYGIYVYQEQILQILNLIGGIPQIHTELIRKAISKKKKDVIEKFKPKFIENGKKTLGVDDQYMEDMFAAIETWSGYGFNASHAYAYADISARQLWLKAHYPLEFYASVFMCEDQHDKVKEYKIDAHKHGIELMPVNVNQSKVNYAIVGDKIYTGFKNIKKLGEATAQRIVAGQPYSSLSDFLERFGTDQVAVRPLIALGAFDEKHDRLRQYKFYQYYKDAQKRRRDRQKRFEKVPEKYRQELIDLFEANFDVVSEVTGCRTLTDMEKYATFDDPSLWDVFEQVPLEKRYKHKGKDLVKSVTLREKMEAVRDKYDKSVRNFELKEKEDDSFELSIDKFKADRWELDAEDVDLLTDHRKAESEYYGFQWRHRLEDSPDYSGKTIEAFLDSNAAQYGTIQVEIKQVMEMTSKKGTSYHTALVEDAHGKQIKVIFWKEEYERFQEELQPGNLISMHVKPPSGGFPSLQFHSPPRHERWRIPKDKASDHRLIVMRQTLSLEGA